MDITVIIPSRGRLRGLSAVVHGMNFLKSGKHRVHFGVVCDEDDPKTGEWCRSVRTEIPLGWRCGPRQPSFAAMINGMAQLMPAQVYLHINDDVLCLTRNWDEVIAQAVRKTPHGVFWWEPDCEQQVLFPIVTEKWRAAAGGIFDGPYPFWYVDLCLAELWVMTTGTDNIVLPVRICDRPRTVTHRMRELLFWQRVYNQSRKLRVQQAHEIAGKLGLPQPQAAQHIADALDRHMKRVSDGVIREIEINQGDRAEPDTAYQWQKREAEKMLAQLAA